MDYIELEQVAARVSTGDLIVGTILWIAGITLLVQLIRNRAHRVILARLVIVAILLGLATAFLLVPSTDYGALERLSDQRDDRVQSQISERYGFNISDRDLQWLEYPATRPQGSFEVFGTTELNLETESGYERKEISLVWKDGGFELAQSTDGKNFTELDSPEKRKATEPKA